MKQLVLLLLFCSAAFVSFSQEVKFESGKARHDKKPKLFSGTSNRFAATASFINEVMNARLQSNATVVITQGVVFKGKVTSITSDAPGLTTVTIQSSDVQGAVLSLSRITLENNVVVYRGVVMSKNHSDMLMLEKDPVTGIYNWNKKEVSNLLAD
jgi:hypothetical protein